MTQLLGLIKDSVGNPVEGYLTIKLNAPMIEGTASPIGVRYTKPGTYLIENGDLSTVKDLEGNAIAGGINLTPSSEPTYTFSFEYDQKLLVLYLGDVLYTGNYHKHTDNKYYTGEIHTTSSQLLTEYNRITKVPLFEPFNSSIPTGASIEWAKLQHSSINTSNLDSSAYYIAELVAKDHATSISVNLARPKGAYNPATQYQKFDVVFNSGDNGTYWYISDTASTGSPITDNTKWMKIGQATSGGGGSGITPADVLLDVDFGASWGTESGKAPTASKLFTQLNKYATLAGTPDFTDNARGVTQTKGNNTDHFATCEFVQLALQGISAPAATTAPDLANDSVKGSELVNARSLKKILLRWVQLTEEQPSGSKGGVGIVGYNTRGLNTYGTQIANADTIIKPFPGTVITLYPNSKYWIEAEACCCGTGRHRLLLCQNNSPTFTTLIKGRSEHTGMAGYQLSVVPNMWARLEGFVETGSSEVACVLRHYFEIAGFAEDKGKPCNTGGPEVYASITIYRLD